MRRLRFIALSTLLVPVALLAGLGRSAWAGDGYPSSSVATTIAAFVELPSVTTPETDGGTTSDTVPAIPCSWVDLPTTQGEVDGINTVFEVMNTAMGAFFGNVEILALTFYERFGVLHRAGDAAGVWLKAQEADCSGANAPGGVESGDFRWVVSLPPDPATLRPGTRSRVTEAILPPVPAISPAGPGYVQLGMWLAVEDPGEYVARAQLPATGPAAVWAETKATLSATSFTFGDGGAVRCDRAGTPIPDWAEDDVREGPCGFTFRDFVGDTAITITSEWTISWQLSDGRSGVEVDPVVLTTVIPYEVREIQTVGVGPARPSSVRTP